MPVSQSTKDLQSSMAQESLLPNLHNAAQHELVFLAHLPPVGCEYLTLCSCEGRVAALGGEGGVVEVCRYLWPIVHWPVRFVLSIFAPWVVLRWLRPCCIWLLRGYACFFCNDFWEMMNTRVRQEVCIEAQAGKGGKACPQRISVLAIEVANTADAAASMALLAV